MLADAVPVNPARLFRPRRNEDAPAHAEQPADVRVVEDERTVFELFLAEDEARFARAFFRLCKLVSAARLCFTLVLLGACK